MTESCFIYISYSPCKNHNNSSSNTKQHQTSTPTMEHSSQDFDEDVTQLSQTQEDDEDYSGRGFLGAKKPKMSASEDLFEEKKPQKPEKRKEREDKEEQSQYGSVILLGEASRLQNENPSQGPMSPRAVKRSFILKFHKNMEELLQDMHTYYHPNQDEKDYEVGLICAEILETLAERSFSKAKWAKDLMIGEIRKRSLSEYCC